MTGVEKLTGATTNLGNYWKAVNWHKVEAEVKRLQMRIAKAVREGKKNKVKVFQWMLSHSFSAKLLKVHYRYRETIYHITIRQKAVANNEMIGQQSVIIDGVAQHDNTIPLVDDLQEHSVEVRIHDSCQS